MPNVPPMVLGIWAGETKPVLNEYLTQLIDELEVMLESGIQIGSNLINVKIGRIICDSPARAFIKGNYREQFQNSHKEMNIFILISIL